MSSSNQQANGSGGRVGVELAPRPEPSPADLSPEDLHNNGRLMAEIIGKLSELNRVGWGREGDIQGMWSAVDRTDLWVNADDPIQYSQDEILTMAESLKHEGQKLPLLTADIEDPRPMGRGHAGTGAKYLVVDGKLRYLGAAVAGLPRLTILNRTFGHVFDIMRERVVTKLTQRPTTRMERCRLVLSLRMAYQIDVRRAEQFRQPSPEWPTMEELGARIGGYDKSEISRYLAIGDCELDFVELVWGELLSVHQAVELLALPPTERLAEARALAQHAAQGKPLTREAVQRRVKATRYGAEQWAAPTDAVPDGLWMQELESLNGMRRMQTLLHDLHLCLDDQLAHLPNPHPKARQIQRLLNDPEVQQFIRGSV